MSLTQISVRRSKANTLGKFLGVILGICLVGGCGRKTEEPQETDQPESPVQSAEDWSVYNGTKITAPADITLYDADFRPAGTLLSGAFADIEYDTGKGWLKLRDEELYVKGSDVKPSDRWFDERTALLPLDQTLHTDDDYILYDVRHNPVVHMNTAGEYRLYVRQGDEGYGVLFQNQVRFIDPADITSVEDDPVHRESAGSLPVLMYHFFYSEENGESRIDGNYVEVDELRSHLQYLKDAGYSTLTMREVLYYMQGRAEIPAASVAITIDDGDPSVHQYAFPVFQEYGMKATLFLICGWEDPVMSWDFWEMREAGLELQSHSFLMHQGGCPGMGHGGRLQCVDYAEGVQDTIMSFDYVDGGFVYCYPFGDYNDHAKQILRDAGTLLAFTTEHGMIHPGMDMLALPRIRVNGGASLEAYAGSLRH